MGITIPTVKETWKLLSSTKQLLKRLGEPRIRCRAKTIRPLGENQDLHWEHLLCVCVQALPTSCKPEAAELGNVSQKWTKEQTHP